MKKHTKLLVLSLTSLMGLGLMSCDMAKAIPTSETTEPEVIQDEATETDAVGNRVKLGQDPVVAQTPVNFAPAIGYQVFNETPEKMSLRIFAVVDGYKAISAAKITSKVTSYREDKAVVGENEQVIKEETEFNVTSVYSSINTNLDVTWSELVSAVDFPNPYYMVYTLNNIPVEHYYDTITLTFSATADSEQTKQLVFNAMGIHGDYAANIRYEDGDEAGTFKAFKKSAGYHIKAAYLPEKHLQINDFYAKPLGDIVALNPGINTGVFEDWSNLEEVHLPDTIKSIGGWALSSSSIKKVNIPVNVVSTGSTLFKSGATVGELDYDAANLVNDSNEYSTKFDVVKVSAGVESLPNKFFKSGYGPTKVVYDGTEAQWAALKTDTNANNGFFIDNVYCSDTTTSTVTYHYGDGKIGDVTGDVETVVINGKALKNPGNPVPNEEGKEFKGWYLDPDFNTPADFEALVNGDVDLYAKYGDFGPGISFDNPTLLDPNSPATFSANLVPGKKAEFMKFTMPATAAHGDWFYLMVNRDASSVAESISSSTYMSPGITVYDSNQAEITLGTDKITDASKAQKVSGDAYRVRFYAEPGETYYFKAMLSTSSSASVYGTIAFDFANYEHDNAEEAIDLAFGAHAAVTTASKYHRPIYKYEATETKTVTVHKDQEGGYYGGFNIVDAANPTVLLASYSRSTAGFVYFEQEAGHTYLIEASGDPVTATSYMTIYVDETPEGISEEKPIALAFGSEVEVPDIHFQYVYYSLTLEEDSDVEFILTGGSSTYAKSIEIDSEKIDEVGTKTSSYSSSLSYGGTLSTSKSLTAGTHIFKVGYAQSVSTFTKFNLKVVKLNPGDNAFTSVAADLSGDSFTANATESGYWYKYTSTGADYLTVLPSGLAGAKVSIYKADGVTAIGSISVGAEEGLKVLLVAGDYYIVVSGAAGEVNLALGHEIPAPYVITNQVGTGGVDGNITTLGEGEGWIEDPAHEGVMKSTIAGVNNGNAVYRFTVTVEGNLFFKWASAGESNYDYLQIFLNSREMVTKGMNKTAVSDFDRLVWTDFNEHLNPGDTVTIAFRKDSSGNNGLDAGFFKEFSFTQVA